jgi:transposase-like protein
LDIRVGSIDMAIPELRRGSYFPGWLLDPRRRAEKALMAVVAECYARGVSTRRVDGLVKTLGIESLSKSPVPRMRGDSMRWSRREAGGGPRSSKVRPKCSHIRRLLPFILTR